MTSVICRTHGSGDSGHKAPNFGRKKDQSVQMAAGSGANLVHDQHSSPEMPSGAKVSAQTEYQSPCECMHGRGVQQKKTKTLTAT